ncbi:hypothetical protein CCZ01_06960 [Helicobacter monodelphidis]|uniref:hypothetical protein n=1 Tax=Helicobacter sp. 15-1451 TaxID=2004995 RepID=UPI000DCC8617|nr:hypothetical protein [Helicobacter sp. 15-1451]RAX57197.1 hypothetical protein CCZ01_06960 [Helicobacter sp. 15-1451]
MRYKVIQDFKTNCVELFPNYNFTLGKYRTQIELLLKFPYITKIDILDFFELSGLCYYCDSYGYGDRFECDELFWEIPEVDLNLYKPTLASEYIHIIGQLFLAGYIDFLCEWDDDRSRIDYPTNLSYYKEDKYQAWIYFRDNFFYKEKFLRKFDDNYHTIDYASWDNPESWSEYNILVARTEKGTKYFNEILSPRFYKKYKDLSVEIDDKGNIIRWIGEINR